MSVLENASSTVVPQSCFLVLPGSEKHVRAVAGRDVRTSTVPNGVDVSTLPEPG